MTSLQGLGLDLLVGVGAILALVAAVAAWRPQRNALAQSILIAAYIAQLVGFVAAGAILIRNPFRSPLLLLIVISLATGLWSCALSPGNRRVRGLANLMIALVLAVYLFARTLPGWACKSRAGSLAW